MSQEFEVPIANRKVSRSILGLGLISLVALALMETISSAVAGQTDDFTVKYLAGTEPVKIISLKIGNTVLESGKKRRIAGNPIKDLKATIKNDYGKVVTYVDLGVIVERPEDQKDLPPFHYNIWLGSRPKALKQEKSERVVLAARSRTAERSILIIANPNGLMLTETNSNTVHVFVICRTLNWDGGPGMCSLSLNSRDSICQRLKTNGSPTIRRPVFELCSYLGNFDGHILA